MGRCFVASISPAKLTINPTTVTTDHNGCENPLLNFIETDQTTSNRPAIISKTHDIEKNSKKRADGHLCKGLTRCDPAPECKASRRKICNYSGSHRSLTMSGDEPSTVQVYQITSETTILPASENAGLAPWMHMIAASGLSDVFRT